MGAALLLFWRLPNVKCIASRMWGVYDTAQTDSNLYNPVPIAESRGGGY